MSQLRSSVTKATSFDPADLSIVDLAMEITEAFHSRQRFELAVTLPSREGKFLSQVVRRVGGMEGERV